MKYRPANGATVAERVRCHPPSVWSPEPGVPGSHCGSGERPLAIVTSTLSDAHTWNLVFIEIVLNENGFQTLNLGPCMPIDEVLNTCVWHRPDLLVVSTVNGLGRLDAGALVRAIRADERVGDLPVVVGGRLGMGGPGEIHHDLRAAGVTEVFTGRAAIPRFVRYLERVRVDGGRTRAGSR